VCFFPHSTTSLFCPATPLQAVPIPTHASPCIPAHPKSHVITHSRHVSIRFYLFDTQWRGLPPFPSIPSFVRLRSMSSRSRVSCCETLSDGVGDSLLTIQCKFEVLALRILPPFQTMLP
jgi:hypothetical protein